MGPRMDFGGESPLSGMLKSRLEAITSANRIRAGVSRGWGVRLFNKFPDYEEFRGYGLAIEAASGGV